MLLGVALLGSWQLWVGVRHVEPFVLPTPGRIVRAGWQSAYLLPHHLWATVVASLTGLLAGAVAGVVLALLIVRVRLIRQVLYPLLIVSQTIPMVVLAPLLIIWFGFGLTPRIVVVALIVFFPVLVSIVTAIDQADPDLLDLVRSMGAAPRQVLRLVLLPSAVPAFFSGLRIASAYTVGGAVIAEFVNPNGGGLGVFITRSRQAYAVDRIFVAVVIIGVLTAVLFAAVDSAARLASPWQQPERTARGRSLKRGPRSARSRLQRTVEVQRLTVIVMVVALAAVAAACGGGASKRSATGLDKVTVVLDWTPNTNHSGIYLARAKGWYREADLDVKVIEPGDTPSLEVLGAGKADVALSVQEEVVPARAKGLPVVSIGAVIQHNTSSLLSLQSAGIKKPGDLPGHTYGGFGGLLEKALIKKFVKCDGGDPARVRFVDVGNADYRVGLQRHQYDVVWIFDGWDGIRLASVDKLPVNRIPFIAHTGCIPDWYTPLIATSEKMIRARPEVLKRFMAATSRGYQTAMRDPGAAADALMKASPELDRDLVQRSARYLASRYAEDPARWGHQDHRIWTRFVAFLRDAGLTDKAIDVDRAYTNRFLPANH